ncbi:MAG TPA: hypothetical protein VJZ00_09520 [Thermoanaerobaculia bacterium]|nr:hypothetical protein [Thermoanaerobaculia bacterium]
MAGIALLLVCLTPLAAANSNNCGDTLAVQSLSAPDVQLGQPVTVSWSYTGTPVSQSLTLADAGTVSLDASARSYTYTPSKPGETRAELSASTSCATASASTKFKVKNCTLAAPALQVSATSVLPGDAVDASVAVDSDATVSWQITNGTPSTATGTSVHIIAGSTGTLGITATVTRNASCSASSSASVTIGTPPPVCDQQPIPIMHEVQWGACPNTPSTATLYYPLPDGATPEWRIEGGTITGGQGTTRITYVVNGNPGESFTLFERLVFDNGCTTSEYPLTMPVLGIITAPTLTFEPATVHAGGTTVITLRDADMSMAGFDFFAENGDSIEPIAGAGDPYLHTSKWTYTSSHGAGVSRIHVRGFGWCGATFDFVTELEILP